jgi:hypothetical protein
VNPSAHAGSPEVIELPAGPVELEAVDLASEDDRRVVETTRAAGCYTLPIDSANLPPRNSRLTRKD